MEQKTVLPSQIHEVLADALDAALIPLTYLFPPKVNTEGPGQTTRYSSATIALVIGRPFK